MKKPMDIPVIITSAVRSTAPFTKLQNEETRLESLLFGIRHWLLFTSVNRLVVCDGSAFELEPYIRRLPNPRKVQVESLAFLNDQAGVVARGKGYGEGEIINFALCQSRMLASAPMFAKCTGKLWVSNLDGCFAGFNGIAGFDFLGRLRPARIDTRFYIVSKDFYQEHLCRVHHDVNDRQGYYLEHAFMDALSSFRMSEYLLIPTPRVKGISGSTGSEESRSFLKCLLRDARCEVIRALGL